MKTLYLASTSASRRQLLQEAKIPFILAGQSADETSCDWNLPLQQLVESIALQKIEHALLPEGNENDIGFVVAADTLGTDTQGVIAGKPLDKHDAMAKIISYRTGATTGTAFCIDRRRWQEGQWHVEQRIIGYAQATYIFDVPDAWLEWYLQQVPYMHVSGAVAIEGVGAQFLKELRGSYTAVVGLPVYEVRQALKDLGFFE